MKLSTLVVNLALGYLISAGCYQTIQWLVLLPFLSVFAGVSVVAGVVFAVMVFVAFIVLWVGSLIYYSESSVFTD